MAERYDVDVIDLNADLHSRYRAKLEPILDFMDESRVVSDALHLYPFYDEVDTHIDEHYEGVPWGKYQRVYITPPSWFPTVPTKAILRLSHIIHRVSPETGIFFFGNSLGSWTNQEELKKNGVRAVHLNHLAAMDSNARPIQYDLLPTPMYEHREKYLFDLLPFLLKHGCPWGRCRFCSFCAGSNSGYVERSVKAAIEELETLIDRYDPAALVCRDHSLNGLNLIQFCAYVEALSRPWCGQSRADLSGKQIEALRKAGCRLIYFGLESGSDRVLRELNKGITSRQMSDFIKELHSHGILPAPSLIVGAPAEEEADFEKTIQFILDHARYLDVVNVYPFMATPGSEFSRQEEQPVPDTPLRLLRFIHTCEDLGLKVILGEQSIEYYIFNWVRTTDKEVP
ncbi:MAG: radical SAM protein [Desulfomonilaceae bacterium]|nr:radical SAM protein [Desulfomonilaceae bacterium]